jgi:hypothetical protein
VVLGDLALRTPVKLHGPRVDASCSGALQAVDPSVIVRVCLEDLQLVLWTLLLRNDHDCVDTLPLRWVVGKCAMYVCAGGGRQAVCPFDAKHTGCLVCPFDP